MKQYLTPNGSTNACVTDMQKTITHTFFEIVKQSCQTKFEHSIKIIRYKIKYPDIMTSRFQHVSTEWPDYYKVLLDKIISVASISTTYLQD